MASKTRLGVDPRERLKRLRRAATQQGLHAQTARPNDQMGYQESPDSPIDRLQERAFSADSK